MDFLRALASIRTPALDAFFSALTHLGGETVFMVLAIAIFWCISKRCGYFILVAGFFGTVFNQFLKIACRVPRPWVLDESFPIVEAARADAGGYSFPSGHTQNAVGTFGALFLCTKNRVLRIICAVLVVLVPFSRMYLGVHTPLDVGVAFLMAIILLALLYPIFRDEARFARAMPRLLALGIVLSVLFAGYTMLYPFSADTDAHNLHEASKNAFTLVGALGGFLLVYVLDRKFIHFDPKAPLLGQILKLVFGLALLLAVKEGLKTPLNTLFGGHDFASAVRYFLMVIFAGAVWPLTFPFFSKLGKRKEHPHAQD